MKGNPMTKGSAPTVDREGGVGYLGLVGLVVSSCIGSGVFALTGQLANVASPGAALVAWAFCSWPCRWPTSVPGVPMPTASSHTPRRDSASSPASSRAGATG